MEKVVNLIVAIYFFNMGCFFIAIPAGLHIIMNAHLLVALVVAAFTWPTAIISFIGSIEAWKEFRKQ